LYYFAEGVNQILEFFNRAFRVFLSGGSYHLPIRVIHLISFLLEALISFPCTITSWAKRVMLEASQYWNSNYTMKVWLTKTAWYWHKCWYEDQWNRKPRNEFTHLSHLIFDKGPQVICWRKGSLLKKWCWENWPSTCKRLKLDSHLSPHMTIKNDQQS
jgi:hypothetical protein